MAPVVTQNITTLRCSKHHERLQKPLFLWAMEPTISKLSRESVYIGVNSGVFRLSLVGNTFARVATLCDITKPQRIFQPRVVGLKAPLFNFILHSSS